MTEVQQKRNCSKCGAEKEAAFCESCKSDTPSDLKVFVSDTIKVRDSLQVRKYGAGIKKFLGEFLGGWFPSGDPKLPDGVDKVRTIDREKNEYHEVVKKYGTDEVVHEKHEPLSDHKK